MTTVLSLGGSIVAPIDVLRGVDVPFLKQFAALIEAFLVKDAGRRFIIVTGGGAPARVWQNAYREVSGGASDVFHNDNADRIGIAATRLNAELVRAVFARWVTAPVITDPSAAPLCEGRVLVGCGWKPGFSSDYDAALLAARSGADTVINLSNIAQVYTADPKEDPAARPIEQISWPDFRKIVGSEWVPGKNVPFDPVASAFAEEKGLKVICASGRDLDNVRKILDRGSGNEPFLGTTIG
ncbi:MAG: UMP kinase [Spirochaetaceae bacterium]|jgi:uridylate kinase|nr:UMP kinase [Spirochaetaceae bacterium]